MTQISISSGKQLQKNYIWTKVFSSAYSGEKMTHLKNAPLMYTLGVINFPKVPDILRFKDKFFDKIRHDYPLPDDVKVKVINTDFSTQGITVTEQENELWQFLSIDKSWGIIFTGQSLCLHTIDYFTFTDFSSRFQKALSAILDVPDIGIDWMTSIGFRYVNLVETKENEELATYINPWVLPDPPSQTNISITEGAYFSRFKTNWGELRLQAFRNPTFTLPIELQSPLIIKNGWIKTRPEKEFAIIDIDHSTACSECSMDVHDAVEKLSNLRLLAKQVFSSIGTEFATRYWDKE